MPRSEPRGSGVSAEHESNNQTPSWKSALALVSLALSLLLWLNGLVTSLQRPSVGDDLSRRQLELTVLAQGNLSEPIRPLLSSGDPLQALQDSLTTAISSSEEDGRTPAPELLLEQALLLEHAGLDPRAQVAAFLDALARFQGEAHQRDDITLLCFQPAIEDEQDDTASATSNIHHGHDEEIPWTS